jgi:hypothetical protein
MITMMTFKKITICVLFLLGFLNISAQERVYMPYFEVINIHPDYQYSASRLLKTYVDNNNKYLLILPEKYDSTYKLESIEESRQKAASLNAKYYLRGELNRLGDVLVVTVSLYNTSDRNKVWSTIKKARNPDDLDPIMTQIGQDLGLKNTSTTEDIYNVSDYESKELNKIGSSRYFGVLIGGGYTFANHVENNIPGGFGLIWTYDSRNFIFDFKGEAYFGDVKIYSISIDGLYPLSSRKNTPFVCAGTGYGGITIKNNNNPNLGLIPDYSSGNGLFLSAGGGYILNRNSDVSFQLSAKFLAPLFDVPGNSFPAGIMISTTLLFGR